MLRLARVQVASHSRHRQHVSAVMTFASVSMILPPHCGHAVGRASGFTNCVSGIASPLCKLAYPSTSTLTSQAASTNPVTIARVAARFWFRRFRRAPAAIHCAQRRSDSALASADVVKFVVMSAMMSDGAADVCSVVHRRLCTRMNSLGPSLLIRSARRRDLRHILTSVSQLVRSLVRAFHVWK